MPNHDERVFFRTPSWLRPTLLLALLLAALLLTHCSAPNEQLDAAARWWSHIEYLASDERQGRVTGSEGYQQAAQYVADQFRELGLEEAGTKGYFQPIEFETRRLAEEASSLEFVRGGATIQFELGEQATLGRAGVSDETVEAEMVFVGYGMTIPEHGYDGFSGLDVKGKVIVTLRGAAQGVPGALASHYQSRDERRRLLERVGAIGSATILNPRIMEIPWERASKFRLQTGMDLADPELSQDGGSKLSFTINPDYGDWFLADAPHSLTEILALDAAGKPLPKFAIPGKIRAQIGLDQSRASSPNVLGVLRGADAALSDEYVLLSAHLDHLGVGEPVAGDRINNGALDNASGVATLIEVARALQQAEQPLKRSVVLLACTAEEKGLLGSRYYAAKPTVEMEKVVANLNFDMYLPIVPLRAVMALGAEESDLGDALRAVAGEAGLEVQPDPEPARNRFIRSDQYNFIKQGVPALAFKFGVEPGSADEEAMTAWYRDRYHSPSDDLSQPVNKEGAVEFNRLMVALVARIANADKRPEWRAESFFRRFTE
ncbi:MAG: M28 family metallopeptidase [Bryobacterales bacterium]